jgi:AcrR family transcriptional regulator
VPQSSPSRNDSSVRSSSRPRRRWARRSDARPSELVSAALHLFAEKGFAATRLEDVAARAGVSKATVYLYFENKERLFEAVARAAVTPRLDQAARLVDAFEGSTLDLMRALLTVFEGALEGPFPALAKLILAESGNFPELARLWTKLAVRRGFALLERVIRRGVERGELRPVDPHVVVPLVMAPIVLLGLWKQSLAPYTDLKLEPHAVLAEHVETLLRGLARVER